MLDEHKLLGKHLLFPNTIRSDSFWFLQLLCPSFLFIEFYHELVRRAITNVLFHGPVSHSCYRFTILAHRKQIKQPYMWLGVTLNHSTFFE